MWIHRLSFGLTFLRQEDQLNRSMNIPLQNTHRRVSLDRNGLARYEWS